MIASVQHQHRRQTPVRLTPFIQLQITRRAVR